MRAPTHPRLLALALSALGACGDDGAASTSTTTLTTTASLTTDPLTTGAPTTGAPTTIPAGSDGGASDSADTGLPGASEAGTTTGAASLPDPDTTSAPDPGTTTTATTAPDPDTTAGESTTGAPACPDNGPPPGPAIRRFDVATLNCPGDSCPADQDQCLCPVDFAALDVAPPHFMATGTDNNKQLVWAAGNFQAMYVDDLNTDWMAGGAARADALIASATAQFDCGAPEWFIINEISASQWPDSADYRQFVVDFADAMKNTHGKTVVIAAPFDKPGNHPDSWTALSKVAYIAAEVYLSGKEVNASGNSVTWCQQQYESAVAAYAALGVPKDRLFLVEHFGQTTSDKSWGRAGVSTPGWHNAIAARAEAAHNVGFAGFISYAWSWNLMHVPADERLAFTATYTAQDLP